MADKTLSFKIDIQGVSNEAQELAKLEIQLKNIKKEKLELQKLAGKGIASNEELRQLAAYNKEIGVQEAALKTLKRVVDTAGDSLARKKALLIQLTAESDKATKAVAAGMAPAIEKLNREIKNGEEARGVFTRNVGNYPKITSEAATGLNQLGTVAGGTFGKITEGVQEAAGGLESLVKGGGVMALVTAAIAVIAKVWKNAKENMDLYLASADKLKYIGAGFEKDAETARIDARKRAQGLVNEGYRIEQEYRKKLDYAFGRYTDLEKESFKVKIASGKQMQIDGKILLDQVRGAEDKVGWEMKYNELLQKQEVISDNKLAKETEWETLEANLVKQRAIVSDIESTAAEKKQASIEADIIAAKLLKEKTEFIDEELININAIAAMTAKEEVYEDQINGLLKEKSTIQKEYEKDQIKINGLERKAANDLKKDAADAKKDAADAKKDAKELKDIADKAAEEKAKNAEKQQKLKQEIVLLEIKDDNERALTKLAFDRDDQLRATKNTDEQLLIWQKYYAELTKLTEEQTKKKTDIEWENGLKAGKALYDQVQKQAEDQWKIIEENNKKEIKAEEEKEKIIKQLKNAVIQGAEMGADAVFKGKQARLQAEMEAELSNQNLSETQKLAIKKKYAREQQKMDVTQAIINGILSVAKTFAQYGFTPAGWIAAGLAGITAGIQVAAIKLQKFWRGGKINQGVHVDTGTKDDTLIVANKTETVLTQDHVRKLGGSATMRRINVPGYEMGGYIGQQAPEIPSQGFDFNSIVNAIRGIQIRLDTNKVYSSLNELQTINETQKI